jgi:hypothetical protein
LADDRSDTSDPLKTAVPLASQTNPQLTAAIAQILGNVISLPQRAIESSETLRQTGQYDPAPIVEAIQYALGGAAPFAQTKGLGALGGKIKAFHGSPYDFEKFSSANIGTGEGAQAYGHGLYFAENPAVAAEYKANLAPGYDRFVGGEPYDSGNPQHLAASLANTFNAKGQGRQVALRSVQQDLADPALEPDKHKLYQQTADVLASDKPLLPFERRPSGKTYEVNINADPEHFLDWDKKVRDMPQATQDKLASLGIDINGPHQGLLGSQIVGSDVLADLKSTATPGDEGRAAWASNQLRQAGIPGIKYLDQGSRDLNNWKINGAQPTLTDPSHVAALQLAQSGGKEAAIRALQGRTADVNGNRVIDHALKLIQGDADLPKVTSMPTHNYVVFDDKLIDILKKYGIAGLVAGLGAQQSQQK